MSDIKNFKPRNISPYALGLKHCSYCKIFLKWSGVMGPCCNTRLRTIPLSRPQKENLKKLLSRKNIKNKILKSIVSVATLSAITGICINHGF